MSHPHKDSLSTEPKPTPRRSARLTAGPERDEAGIPPTARRILDAAKQLLQQKGYEGLRWDAIAQMSGSNKSMIRYYFGDSSGLVAALVDDLTHDATLELVEMARGAISDEERVTFHLTATRKLVDVPSFKALYDVLPHALRNQDLGQRLGRLYEWYRDVNIQCFGGLDAARDDRDLRSLACIFMAGIDGLALQLALDKDSVDADRCWGVLDSMVRWYLYEGRFVR